MPGDVNDELVKYCREKDILLEAYSPLAHGEVFKVPEITENSKKIQCKCRTAFIKMESANGVPASC